MLALVDGDIVRYRTGFASNDTTEGIACWRANETMEQILRAVGATEYRVFLSDSKENNYRYKIYPRYKESREKQPKPTHHEALKKFLEQEWGADIAFGQEADDALGIHQTTSFRQFERNQVHTLGSAETSGNTDESKTRTVICSIDKDLLQVPGRHYNWVRDEYFEQTEIEGLRCFYEQCLSGDRTDDVHGIRGIGSVKAKRALQGLYTEQEMFDKVRGMWNDDAGFLLAAQLLWIRRTEGEIWRFPSFTHDTIPKLQSSSEKLRAQGHLSEHGSPEKSGVPEHGFQMEDIILTDLQDLT